MALAEKNGVDRERVMSILSSSIFDCLIYKVTILCCTLPIVRKSNLVINSDVLILHFLVLTLTSLLLVVFCECVFVYRVTASVSLSVTTDLVRFSFMFFVLFLVYTENY